MAGASLKSKAVFLTEEVGSDLPVMIIGLNNKL